MNPYSPINDSRDTTNRSLVEAHRQYVEEREARLEKYRVPSDEEIKEALKARKEANGPTDS